MEAKDFWNFLCEKHNYRFFTGVPCVDLLPLYNNMCFGDMHYIPAANENIGINMAYGTRIAGFKSVVLLASDRLEIITVNKVDMPLLILAGGKRKVKTTFKSIQFSENVVKLNLFINKIESTNELGIIFIGKGDII